MKIYEVLVEYVACSLDRTFSYIYEGDKVIEKFARVLVPFNNREICGIVMEIIDIDDFDDYSKSSGYEIKKITKIIDEHALIDNELFCLAKVISDYYFAPLISVFFSMLPPSLKPSISYKNNPQIAYDYYVKANDGISYEDLTPKQKNLLKEIIDTQPVKKNSLPPHLLKQLIAKKKVSIYSEEKNRYQFEEVTKTEDLSLNEEQRSAYEKILSSRKGVFLLEGVTGSGKTEVYLQLSKQMIMEKKKIIMLVPEISLSYGMLRRFQERFDRIAILHSELTPAQKYDEYRRIKNSEVDIVIGARSAIFAPIDNIGLIIIDEEHSETYKQDDKMPYYNAIEVAKMRQSFNPQIKIVLGSATPSLETKSRAVKGVYELVQLTKRVNDIPLPEVSIVDLSRFENIDRDSNVISLPLRREILKNLQNNEQTILLVNRRGYSPYVSCRKCGYVVKCPECQVALTYHNEGHQLRCHHCGFETFMIDSCPKCHSNKIIKSGFGTEKIEQEILKLFPQARVDRLDLDVTKKRNMAKNILSSFNEHQSDILIGTQIVSKGHDFSNVTLVGIVLADIGLAIPSYRASERTFDLITQAIGRSGRNKFGRAIIQTYQPDNFVIQTASKQDYSRFFASEMYYRKMLQNPPYTYQTLLIVSGMNEESVVDAIYEVHKYLESHCDNNFIIVGPTDMFLKKYQNKYRRKILLKYKNFEIIKPLLQDLRLFFNRKGSLSLQINVDPCEDY